MMLGGLVVSRKVICLMFLLIFNGFESVTFLLVVIYLYGIGNSTTMHSATATMILVQLY